jgi:hypothetical protein
MQAVRKTLFRCLARLRGGGAQRVRARHGSNMAMAVSSCGSARGTRRNAKACAHEPVRRPDFYRSGSLGEAGKRPARA